LKATECGHEESRARDGASEHSTWPETISRLELLQFTLRDVLEHGQVTATVALHGVLAVTAQ
jgi:hypothetical protein